MSEHTLYDVVITCCSVCGELVAGVWPCPWPGNGHINCAQLANTANVIAVGDDDGHVQLYQYPAKRVSDKQVHAHTITTHVQTPTPLVSMTGHSANVTDVAFTFDDSYLVSTGGNDSRLSTSSALIKHLIINCSVFVWKVVATPVAKK